MNHLPSPVPYREDINGLRAWAVIAVLLFHFQLPGLGAGFMGVDIFFVISGFLMTAIIVKGLERNNFSIWKFYMARARRILPALMVVITVLLVLGWFFLPTPDYKALGAQSAYSLGFLSNIYFWRSTGYFDAAAHEKWLLHTWSLAVEAQFYLLFPIFLIMLWKIKPQLKTLFWALGLVFIASLALSIVVSQWKPSAAFYLLPTRGWELAAGGLAFLIGRKMVSLQKYRKPLLWSGFGLWVLAIVLLDSGYAWPSGWALLPVLGTVLIILSHQTQAKITVNPVAQWLGDRSYSLYLWHWPLVVALYFAGLQNDWLWVSGAIALSLVLAHLSYHLVEVPTRSYLSAASQRKEIFAIALAGLVIGLAAVSVRVFTFENRLPPAVELAAAEATNIHPRRSECHSPASGSKGSPGCEFGVGDDLGVILTGDSHAMSTVNPITIAAELNNRRVKLWSFSACPTIKGAATVDRGILCKEATEWVTANAKKFAGLPIIVSNSSGYFARDGIWLADKKSENSQTNIKLVLESYIDTLCELKDSRELYVIRPYPLMNHSVPHNLSRNLMFGRGNDDIKITLEEYHQRHKLVWEAQDQAAEQCGVKILDPLPYLCDDQYCYGSRNGRPLYFDDDHLSEYGNKYLVPMFEQVFRDQLSKD